jgi:hypothetical protein
MSPPTKEQLQQLIDEAEQNGHYMTAFERVPESITFVSRCSWCKGIIAVAEMHTQYGLASNGRKCTEPPHDQRPIAPLPETILLRRNYSKEWELDTTDFVLSKDRSPVYCSHCGNGYGIVKHPCEKCRPVYSEY